MERACKAVKVTDNVYWVGAVDWDVRNFHGYLTSRGTTYNAYLVMADKIALIDTVKAPFADEMMSRIASVVEPDRIEYIVSNHSEMDHSGCLPQTIEAVRPAEVFASKMGVKALSAHFGDLGVTAVADGDSVALGNMTLSFVETRMCHWPDSMVSYLDEDELLFSQDAFGMHLAGGRRFADELDRHVLDHEAAKYYANILLHLAKFIRKTLDRIDAMDLPLSVVAPDHGPIWRTKEDIERIVAAYTRWAEQAPTDKAVVVYDSMWQSTTKMARAIGEGLIAGGAEVKLMSMTACHRSDVATELLEAGAIVVGSPTMNNTIFPTIADVMTYLKGLKPRNLIGAAFGSYGWSGEAAKDLHAMLAEMGVEMVAEPLRVNYVPHEAALLQCRELGQALAEALQAGKGGQGRPFVDRHSPPRAPAGQCAIDVNDGLRRIDAAAGRSLFETLNEQGILLPTICGGAGLCGCCKVTVLAGGGPVTPAERERLSPGQLEAQVRLACQVTLRGDLAVRVPVELLDARPFRGEVEAMGDLTHDIKLLRIRLTGAERIRFTPGRYVKLALPPGVGPAMASRAFSIASAPSDEGHIDLIVRLNPAGVCTNWIFGRLKVGQGVTFNGPYGEFGLSESDREMIWVAGGSGMSAFRSILRHMVDTGAGRKCTLFFGAAAGRDLYMQDELRLIAAERDWFTFVPALSAPAEDDDWAGETGLITEVLDRRLEAGLDAEAYLCGRPDMIAAAGRVLARKGIGPERTFYDEFIPAIQ